MKAALQLLAILALAGTLLGQEKPKDIDGWDKIKWGMTLEQARTAHKITEPIKENEYWASLALNPVKVGDMQMSASAAAKRGTLETTQVTLVLGFNEPGYDSGFATLKTLLIQKYGPRARKPRRSTGIASKRFFGRSRLPRLL